jgi:pentatricopeptide repeat protein
MVKNPYRFLYFSLLLLAGISIAYYFDILNRSSGLRFLTSSKKGLQDSAIVLDLNQKAYAIRATDPAITVALTDSSIKVAEKIAYTAGMAEAYRIRGIGYFRLDSIRLALKDYQEAFKYYKELGNINYQARVYMNIGSLYMQVDAPRALGYYQKAMRLTRNLNDEALKADLYLNIGTTYDNGSDYEKAMLYMRKAYTIYKLRGNTSAIILYHKNYGAILRALNRFDEAEINLLECIRLAKKYNLTELIPGTYISLLDIYTRQNRFSEAEKVYNESLYYTKNNHADTRISLLHMRYLLEMKRKNYKLALQYLRTVYSADSLQLKNEESDNIRINSRHNTQLLKIQAKELTIARQRYRERTFWWTITSIVALFLLSIIVAFVVYRLVEKKREKEKLEIQNNITTLEQKALQAMMNPHFVFNVMNSIQHFINQADPGAANQILTGFARLVRKHLEICLKSSVSIQEEIVYLNLYLSLEKSRFIDKMSYKITVDQEIEDEDISIPPMLIQPFIENAILHGIMPMEKGGFIDLNVSLKNDDVWIRITDDGVGISNSLDRKKSGHTSRGMKLINDRVELLNKLNKKSISIAQKQTGDFGTEVLIKISA